MANMSVDWRDLSAIMKFFFIVVLCLQAQLNSHATWLKCKNKTEAHLGLIDQAIWCHMHYLDPCKWLVKCNSLF